MNLPKDKIIKQVLFVMFITYVDYYFHFPIKKYIPFLQNAMNKLAVIFK